MRSEHEAADRAEAYNRQHKLLGPRTWKGEAFDGGWLMLAQGEDTERWSGVLCLVILDDGRIFEDNSSTPHHEIVARHARGTTRPKVVPIDVTTAAARAAHYGDRHLAYLGPRTWSPGDRFAGGWLLKPEGEDMTWNFSMPAVIALDDGRVFQGSGSAPAMYTIRRYEEMLAREAAQG